MQGLCEHINAGFGEVHDLHKVFKGEEVTVGIALNGINGIFSTGKGDL